MSNHFLHTRKLIYLCQLYTNLKKKKKEMLLAYEIRSELVLNKLLAKTKSVSEYNFAAQNKNLSLLQTCFFLTILFKDKMRNILVPKKKNDPILTFTSTSILYLDGPVS